MLHPITDEMISQAKTKTTYYNINDIHHQHNDCIRACYEWLDAQTPTKTHQNHINKAMVEQWTQQYVSNDDLTVAITLHPKFSLSNNFKCNCSKSYVFPNPERLKNISTFKAPNCYHDQTMRLYKKRET